MLSRDRLLGAINRKPIDRVPMMEGYWTTTIDNWHKQGLPKSVTFEKAPEHFGQDLTAGVYVDWSFQYPAGIVEETDEYTITISSDNVKTKTMKNSASMLELSEYSITCRDDWEANKGRLLFNESRIDAEKAKDSFSKTRDTHLQVYTEPCIGFEKFKYCMGTEGLLLAIADDPDMIKEMTEYTLQLAIDGLEYCLGLGVEFDAALITEDMGFSNGPFFSPAFYREIIMPSHKRWNDLLHSKGMKSMLHTCGDNRKLLSCYAEIGFDVINPLEQKAGMDIYKIKKDYGDIFTLWGGIDVGTISFGSLDELHDEIRDKVLMAKQGYGYIFGSDHSIPENVPLTTYHKMLEWGLEYGKY